MPQQTLFPAIDNRVFPVGPYGSAMHAVYTEIKRAKAKHGPQNFNSNHEGYAVLLEEVDEMWAEVKKDNTDLSVYEAVHVAAMAIRYIAERGKFPYNKPQEQILAKAIPITNAGDTGNNNLIID
jgi:hypothetical protein